MVEERRIEQLESRVERLTRRVERIERGAEQSAVATEPSQKPARFTPAPPPRRPEAPAARPAATEAPATPGAGRKATAAPPAGLEAPAAPERPAPARPESRLELPGLEQVLRDRTFEDLLGGRVLAWVGGLAVLLGIVFLFAVAVSSGWIGEGARTLLGGAGSAALLGVGVWLHERRGRTDAALAAVAAGVAGLFVTLTVAAQVYEVLPALAALMLAMGVGALATGLALQWESRGVAALGILGALVSPALAGAPYDSLTMAILLVAAGSAVGVLLWQRWDWLSLAVFAATVPQWANYLVEAQSLPEALLVLAGFAAVGVAAAAGYELRTSARRLRASSAFLLVLNALAVGLGGYAVCRGLDQGAIGTAWLWALAAAHVSVGLIAGRRDAGVHDFGLLALAIGALLADVAFALTVDGPFRTVGFAGASVAFAALVRLRGLRGHDEALTTLGLGFHLSLAVMQTLADAPPGELAGGDLSAAGGASLLALAAGCFVSARLAQQGRRELRIVLDVLGLAATAYLTALALDGAALAVAWSLEAAALGKAARHEDDGLAAWGAVAHLGLALLVTLAHVAPFALRSGDVLVDPLAAAAALGAISAAAAVLAALTPERLRDARAALEVCAALALTYLASVLLDGVALVLACSAGAVVLAELSRRLRSEALAITAVGHVGGALTHALCFEAPPTALVEGLAAPGTAAVALGAVALAGILSSARGHALAQHRDVSAGAVAVTLLYLASVLVVTPFQAGAPVAEAGLLELDARQQGQVALSAMWALVGLGSLVVGLRRDRRPIRLGALGLLVVSVGKVFMFDLATLTSIYRVISFIVLGLLLLIGAFVWQRLRPGPVPDMREAPAGIR